MSSQVIYGTMNVQGWITPPSVESGWALQDIGSIFEPSAVGIDWVAASPSIDWGAASPTKVESYDNAPDDRWATGGRAIRVRK